MPNKILIVDDEASMRLAMQETLRRSGYDVVTAGDGQEGLLKLKDDEVQLVITDMKMPRMSGIDFLKNIKKTSPQMPVVMVTAYATVNNAVEAMKEGAFDYLLKPFSPEALEEVVHRVFLSISQKEETRPVRREGASLRQPVKVVTSDPVMKEILERAESTAASKSTVLIQGESGTGKEVVARFIHDHSPRNEGPFVAVNCAALPEGLLESELFGHERGAFTGAVLKKVGKFELADSGTILLDEISEMPLPLQAKLLRVIQEKQVDRVGGQFPISVDVKIIATTNVDLKKAVKEKKFREDLYFRINVIPLTLPPLRERKGDIPLLADHFIKKYATENQKKISGVGKETLALLKKYDWPGNVRELENVIERAVVVCRGETIEVKDLFLDEEASLSPEVEEGPLSLAVGTSLQEMEKKLILTTLDEMGGNRTKAADVLGISIRTMRNKLKEYRIQED
ncbi:MAG: sigma-54 dependent transcriptional regulator [Nitrospirota bacterium]|nr:sigma-54 dependent transcriptional regulator [Nitrospirota bacterium]